MEKTTTPKVLLAGINAKFIHTNLAIRSLKANARRYEPMVEICEYTINHRREEIFAWIYEKKPDVIGFSCYLWNIDYVMAIACDLKKILPHIQVMLGGPEVSYHPEEVLEKNPFIDVVMVGEGELTFYEYLGWLAKERKERKDIPGLVYREAEGQICRTEPRVAMDMDDLVFPYSDMDGLENRILYYESIRGCPFSCSYCLSSIEKRVRIKSLEKTKKELDFFLRHKVPQVKFVDRTFNCDREYAYEVWKYIGEKDNGVTNFHFEIGGDLLREKDFELLRTFRRGLVQFEIGVQSTNPDTIQAIRRTMDLKKLENNIYRVHQGGNIHQHLDLIAGLPYEDYTSFRQSFNDVYAMKPDQFQLGFLKVLDGSHMDEVKDDYGVRYSSRPPYEVFSTKWLSYEDVLQLKQVEEMVEVYYNSFQFAAAMSYLVRFFPTPFDLYRELGCYYKERSLLDVKHSRLERYEILWEFSMEKCVISEEEREDLRQVMTFDLYSRDYVKNPPDFVTVRSQEKKRTIRTYFDRISQSGEVPPGYEGAVTRQLYHMLYVNEFTLDMDSLTENGEIVRTAPRYLMFDYKKRNPLNNSAEITEIVIDN
jgi:radical SAM superfamily enzyme YgiQ (UPF0313 family)